MNESSRPENAFMEPRPNSPEALKQRVLNKKINWKWPVLILFARTIFAFFAQAIVAAIYAAIGDPSPWQAAAPWWTVHGTLIDVGCLLLLLFLVHKEGIRLIDLISVSRNRIGRDLILGVGIMFLFIAVSFGFGNAIGFIIYGTIELPTPYGSLPTVALLYSIIVFPIIWGITEQMTYNGYVFPRLEALSGRAWVAVLVVAAGWALQHIALPFQLDVQFSLLHVLPAFFVAIMLILVYTRIRRLLPLIVAHWGAQVIAIVFVQFLS